MRRGFCIRALGSVARGSRVLLGCHRLGLNQCAHSRLRSRSRCFGVFFEANTFVQVAPPSFLVQPACSFCPPTHTLFQLFTSLALFQGSAGAARASSVGSPELDRARHTALQQQHLVSHRSRPACCRRNKGNVKINMLTANKYERCGGRPMRHV